DGSHLLRILQSGRPLGRAPPDLHLARDCGSHAHRPRSSRLARTKLNGDHMINRPRLLESPAASGLGFIGASTLPTGDAPAHGEAAGATRSGGPRKKARRPNLVFVFADQLRVQSCGYYGGYANDPLPYTPNLDALQKESCDFRNAVAGSPICCAYRASLLTGKYQSSTGMVINELRVMPDPDAIGHVL